MWNTGDGIGNGWMQKEWTVVTVATVARSNVLLATVMAMAAVAVVAVVVAVVAAVVAAVKVGKRWWWQQGWEWEQWERWYAGEGRPTFEYKETWATLSGHTLMNKIK
jgi:hypothetical protein